MMPDRKKNNRIIIAIIFLFVAVTISGLFIIDAVLNNDIEKRNQQTETTESTEKVIDDKDIKNEIQTKNETTEENNGGWEKPTEVETQETIQQSPIETTPIPTQIENSEMISIGNDILQNIKPVDSTLIKKMGEEKYYFKTYIENNTKYTITSITLSYQVSPNDFTYIMYQGNLAPGQKTEELSCSAASGTETYPLFSEEISFLDENGNEHVMSYNAITKEMQCY